MFKDLRELEKAIEKHETFNHEIKGKRIRKELSNLDEIEEGKVEFAEF